MTDNVSSSTTTTGTLVVTGGVGVSGQVSATTLVETSSIVFKENINPIENALDYILQLEGVIYDRKDGSRKNEPGLLAERVATILPNLVTYKDGRPDSVNYTKISVYLIESIKSIQHELNKLKGKN